MKTKYEQLQETVKQKSTQIEQQLSTVLCFWFKTCSIYIPLQPPLTLTPLQNVELQIENQLLLQAFGDFHSPGNSNHQSGTSSPIKRLQSLSGPSSESLISPESNAPHNPAMLHMRKQTIEANLTSLFTPPFTSAMDPRARNGTIGSVASVGSVGSFVSFQDSPALYGIYHRHSSVVSETDPGFTSPVTSMSAIREHHSMETPQFKGSGMDPVATPDTPMDTPIPMQVGPPSGAPRIGTVPTMELGGNSSRRPSMVGRYSIVNNGVVLLPLDDDREGDTLEIDELRIEYEGKLKELREQNDELRYQNKELAVFKQHKDALLVERETLKEEIGRLMRDKQEMMQKYQMSMDSVGLKEAQLADLGSRLRQTERELDGKKGVIVDLQNALREMEMNNEAKGTCYQGWLW